MNHLSVFWFNYVSDILPNHVLSTKLEDFPKEFQNEAFHSRTMLVKKLEIIPVECIVRGYISGSAWKNYTAYGEICGIKMPAGLQESEKAPIPIVYTLNKSTPWSP